MKERLTKLNSLQKMLLSAIVVGACFMLISIIGVVLGQPGWLIGVALGTAIEIVNIFLLYKGSSFVLDANKAPLFLLFFFLRMLLAAGIFFLCLVLDRWANITAFHNSIWGAVIGFAPIEIIVLLVMSKEKKEVEVK